MTLCAASYGPARDFTRSPGSNSVPGLLLVRSAFGDRDVNGDTHHSGNTEELRITYMM